MTPPLSATLLADRSDHPWDSCVVLMVGAPLGVGEAVGVRVGVTATVGVGVLGRGAATLTLPFPLASSRSSEINARISTMRSGRPDSTCGIQPEATFRNMVALLSLQLLCCSEQGPCRFG